MHDIASMQPLPAVSREQVREQLSTALALAPYSAEDSAAPVVESKPGRGRPTKLAPAHLWLGLLWAMLEGLQGYSALTRYLATHALGRFAPTSAVPQRAQQATHEPLQQR